MSEEGSHMDPRLTVVQGMEMFGIQFEEGCGSAVCINHWGPNCHCMDTLCTMFPDLVGKREAIQRSSSSTHDLKEPPK